MIAIVDYGVGNLFSLSHSLEKIGAESVVTGEKKIIESADKIILPGVGAFGDAIKKLRQNGLSDVVANLARAGKPVLGICLGMQLLFDKSYEYGVHSGLGLIEGEIVPLKDVARGLKIPHMGWNSLHFTDENPIFADVNEGDYVYFVHSYYAKCANSLSATTFYGEDITAAVRKGNIFGVQFHPEKSGKTGLNILRAFAALR